MKKKEYQNFQFLSHFEGVLDKMHYKKIFLSKNLDFFNNQLNKGLGFHSLPLDYDPFEGCQITVKQGIKFSNANFSTFITYSIIIEKDFYNDLTKRFNLGKFQIWDLKDKLFNSKNEYFLILHYYNNLQDLAFEKCEYIYYNGNTNLVEECNLKFENAEEFQNYKMKNQGNSYLDLRVGKYVFNEAYFDYDILILNEFENLATTYKFSSDLSKYLMENKVKCLFTNPFEVYYSK